MSHSDIGTVIQYCESQACKMFESIEILSSVLFTCSKDIQRENK